jgi:hypothetical protein
MLPDVSELVSLERAGGVLGASFRDAGASDFRLVVPICPGDELRQPELHRFVPHRYSDKFTGGLHTYETREDTPLTWDDAARLLARLAPLLAPESDAGAVYPAMVRAVASRGADLPLPPANDPHP